MSLGDLLVIGSAELGITLSGAQLDQLLLLMAELRRWNQKVNLTAITGEREIVIKHFLDSLTVVPLLPEGARVLDLGSGGGFPAIPLAVARPDLDITSVDATLKKIHFQRDIARLLGLQRFTALHARGETLAANHAGRFHVVVSRAFSSLSDFVAVAQPLLDPGGVIIAMKGKSGGSEAMDAAADLAGRSLSVREVTKLRLPFSGYDRTLVIIASG